MLEELVVMADVAVVEDVEVAVAVVVNFIFKI